MVFDSTQFPIFTKLSGKLLADDIVGIRPGETSLSALNRHIMEQRRKKLEKIKNRINDRTNKRIND